MTDEAIQFLMADIANPKPCDFSGKFHIPCGKPSVGGFGMYSHYCEEHSSKAFESFLRSIDDYT